MRTHTSLAERFWASARWPLWKQLCAAAATVAVVGLTVALLSGRSTSPAPAAAEAGLSSTSAAPLETKSGSAVTPATTAAPPLHAATSSPALEILEAIPVEREHHAGYDRDLFAVWSDADGDGCDTRAEVLIQESASLAQVDPGACVVVAGDWRSPYDDVATSNPGEMEIDHVVALKEAWDSGAWQWTADRRIAFANDLSDSRTLLAVSATSNRAKGDADPSNWLPQPRDVCRYVGDWVAIKARWSLSMDESEWGRLARLLRGDCTGIVVVPWPPTP